MHFYFDLLGKRIPSYSIMILLGLLIGNMIAFILIKKYKLDKYDFIIIESYTLIGAFMGAKVLYIYTVKNLIDWSQFFKPEYLNTIMKGGFVFYGGLIGGMITCLIGAKIHKIDVKIYIEKLIFLVPLVHGFGRIGCFMAGCCYGIPYHGIFSVRFPEQSFAPAHISLFPVQLLETICLFCLSFAIYLFTKNRLDEKGIQFYCIGYGLIRFGLEYLRYDYVRGRWLIFSTSQWISLLIISCTVGWVFCSKKFQLNINKGELN